MVVILSVLDSFACGVYVPRQTAVLTFVHRYVIAFRCGATSGAIYRPMSPPALYLQIPCRNLFLFIYVLLFYFPTFKHRLLLSCDHRLRPVMRRGQLTTVKSFSSINIIPVAVISLDKTICPEKMFPR